MNWVRVAQRRIGRTGEALIVLSAVLMGLPSLATGLFDDDIWQRRFVLDHLNGERSDAWWEMFGLPTSSKVQRLIHDGILPWWTSPDFRMSFFRPLAAATHFLDYRLWPDTPWLMHLHSVFVYGLLCLGVAKIYQRVLGPGVVAILAGFLYAIDDAHLEAVAWIAARNSILTAAFCALTLVLLELRWRSRSHAYSALAALALAAAHLSSEGAIAVWPYLLARAVLSWRRRSAFDALLALAPCAAVSIGFGMLTTGLGYKVVGGGAYIDPRVRPGEFAAAVLERLPVLLREQFGPPTWLAALVEKSAYGNLFWSACALVWLAVAALALPRVWHKRGLQALLLGSFGSAIVVCAARPEPRLLLMVGVGAHALFAELLVASWRALRSSSGPQRIAWTSAALWIALLHLILVPPGSFSVPEWYRQRDRAFQRAALNMDIGPDDSEWIIALLNAPSYFDGLSICMYRMDWDPESWRVVHILGTSERAVTLTRAGVSSLMLEPEQGYLLERTSQQARSPTQTFRVGQTIRLFGLDVIVEAVTDSGRPDRIRLDYDPDHVRFLTWSPTRRTFERVALPEIGRHLQL